MSPAPEYAQPIHHATPVNEADVIDIAPRVTTTVVAPAAMSTADHQDDIVILGRAVPRDRSAVGVATRPSPTGPASVRHSEAPTEVGSVVDHGGLHQLMVNRRERYYSAPPPPRVRHRSWMLSSVLIAVAGVMAVMVARDATGVSVVGTVALVAAVVCGAVLVAAQVAEEVRQAGRR